MIKKLLLIISALFAFSSTAFAHPHIWAENVVEFVMENKNLRKINVKWIYDEVYSSTVVFEYDLNTNDVLDPEEKNAYFESFSKELKEKNYLTHIDLNNKEIHNYSIRDFKIDYRNEQIIQSFTISFNNPIDVSKDEFNVAFYDETYYTEYFFDKKTDATLSGTPDKNCEYIIYEDPYDAYYYGVVYPEKVQVLCR